ncbi:hypothetical protein NMA58_08290 [Rhizobium sp. YTUHZ045]|uniref:hypothetical protein n=1 Tax=Rhizobium sp. YTUHZ045 TaxID=2962888 RepID=UPI003DA9512A
MPATFSANMTVLPELVGERIEMPVTFPGKTPNLDGLRKAIEPHLDGQKLEHVAVLWHGRRCSMFVGETSTIDGRIRNVEATAIYRNNWLSQHPETDPEELPPICGPAVLFDRNVWF